MLLLSAVLVGLCIFAEYSSSEALTSNTAIKDIGNREVHYSTNNGRDSVLLDVPLLASQAPRRSKWIQAVQAFNPTKNTEILLKKAASRSLEGLDGIRAFSMLWIILAHTSLLSLVVGTTMADAPSLMRASFTEQFPTEATEAVDSFFFLSGTLTAYTLLPKLKKQGLKCMYPEPLPIIWFRFHQKIQSKKQASNSRTLLSFY